MNIAYTLRPQNLDEFVGQEHLVGSGGIVRRMISSKTDFSIIFWGPPGVGKTTLAHIIAKSLKAEFYGLQAVTAGKADLLEIVKIAEENKKQNKKSI